MNKNQNKTGGGAPNLKSTAPHVLDSVQIIFFAKKPELHQEYHKEPWLKSG